MKEELLDQAGEVDRELHERALRKFDVFYRSLILPSAAGPVIFDDCMADFQKKCFEDMAPSLHAVKWGKMPPKKRFWIERTKKSGKDSDLAVCLLWLMASSDRPLLVQVCAANQKQAGIIKSRIESIVHYNGWLNDHVRVVQNKIVGLKLGGELVKTVIEATGTAGATQGETPDILVLNELVHVDKFSVMEAHMNNATGVPRGVVIVSTNAGIKGTKAELWRKEATSNSKRWSTHIFDGIAPWLNEEDVEEAKRRDPLGMEFDRLWKGKWISGRGGAVDEDSISKCFASRIEELRSPEQSWLYVAGLDLGISHDHSGVVSLGIQRESSLLRLAYMEGWKPTIPNDKGILEVDLESVESRCLWLAKTFHILWFGYDPAAGGSFMAQRLRKRGVPMREMTFANPSNLRDMAESFVTAVKDGKLECYDDEEGRLRRDFGKFTITHRPPSKYKLEAISDEYGHADVGTALLICLPKALKLLQAGMGYGADDEMADDGIKLTKEEEEEMPDDLKDICDAYGEDKKKRSRSFFRKKKVFTGKDDDDEDED